jgi:gamma-glutamylcyclotransferase (GGCT)/AIG2-like uncharacterized protein YtfP
MIAEETSGGVTGELYEIPEALLPLLDDVESVPDLYLRVTLAVTCPEHAGEPLEALAYVYQLPVGAQSRIESGHWATDTGGE